MMKTLTALAVGTLATGCATTLATNALAGEPIEVTAPGPEGDLAGTLVAPADGKPIVLIHPGSGPTDRDGNSPLGVTAAPYRLLAEDLAAKGIGSLRIDKRGMFGSKAAIPNPNDITTGAYADDLRAWIDVAKAQTGVPCVWLMGHSEGGLHTLVAAQSPEDICGIMLVASVGRPLGDTLREQLRSNPANAIILDEALAAIDKLEAGERVDGEGMHPALRGLFAPAVQGFLIDMFARNPGDLAKTVDVPMLIVAGGKDIQTPVADAQALAAGQPDATLIVIDDMNHVLKKVESDGRAANLATYADSALPVHPELVQTIAAFMTDLRD